MQLGLSINVYTLQNAACSRLIIQINPEVEASRDLARRLRL